MFLINWKINLILTWSENFVIFSATEKTKFEITDTKLYVPVVTLLTQGNAKWAIEQLLEQLKYCFKRTISWNKYQSKVSKERQNQDLDLLIDPSSQGQVLNWLFVLLFENEGDAKVQTEYYLPEVETDGKNFFDQPFKSDKIIYDEIWNIETDQGDDYTTGYLLDYPYFKKIKVDCNRFR